MLAEMETSSYLKHRHSLQSEARAMPNPINDSILTKQQTQETTLWWCRTVVDCMANKRLEDSRALYSEFKLDLDGYEGQLLPGS